MLFLCVLCVRIYVRMLCLCVCELHWTCPCTLLLMVWVIFVSCTNMFACVYILLCLSSYVGIVADEESRKLGFSILRATYSVGGILNFFLASVMPVYVNVILLVFVVPVSIILYIVGELVYAKDRA